jgi:hypothetical protein
MVLLSWLVVVAAWARRTRWVPVELQVSGMRHPGSMAGLVKLIGKKSQSTVDPGSAAEFALQARRR